MVLPIVAYGHPVLRKVAQDIDPGFPQLDKLIADVWETMYASNGVGLAAPQVNKDIRLFIVDSQQIFNNLEPDEKEKFPDDPGIKQIFLNAHIEEVNGEKWSYNEGCLSIPKIREDISRNEIVKLRFVDENFKPHVETYRGITARVVLHEYDHIEGKLFTDKLSPLRKRLIEKKLNDISKGMVDVDYKMKFPNIKKGR